MDLLADLLIGIAWSQNTIVSRLSGGSLGFRDTHLVPLPASRTPRAAGGSVSHSMRGREAFC
jgi:hypothetical protein